MQILHASGEQSNLDGRRAGILLQSSKDLLVHRWYSVYNVNIDPAYSNYDGILVGINAVMSGLNTKRIKVNKYNEALIHICSTEKAGPSKSQST